MPILDGRLFGADLGPLPGQAKDVLREARIVL